jgi:putative two-component system response regulator
MDAHAVLVADDVPENRQMLSLFLTDLGFRMLEAGDGLEALQLAREQQPDIVILDIDMPRMDGIQACRILKSSPRTRMIPVVIVTALSDDSHHLEAVRAGADDFLPKPFNIHFLRARLKTLLTLKMINDQNLRYQEKLKQSNVELLEKLVKTQDVTIIALAKLAEFRDPETGEHLQRMREHARNIAVELQEKPEYREQIDQEFVENIYKSTPLHDIGKVGIPDRILLKPGRLDAGEFEIMKQHAVHGGNAVSEAIRQAGLEKSFLDMGRDIAYHHHERWNGTGYPEGLRGAAIPLAARIAALADVYDALRSTRVYKTALSHGEARRIILEESEGHFDPAVVETFRRRGESFQRVHRAYREPDTRD